MCFAVITLISREVPDLDLATGDLDEWCVRLADAGRADSVARVRALPEYT